MSNANMIETPEGKKISEVFTAVQYNRTCHPKYLKNLRKLYDKMELDTFFKEFVSNLRVPMTYIEKHPHVENALRFAAEFIISIQPKSETEDADECDEMCAFLAQTFEFLLKSHNAKDKAIRYRVCYFLNMLLDTMGDNATIEDELCNKIMQSMMERILDKSPKVRAQAAIALHRLQEPQNPACPVINVYIFHLTKDPSAEVRRVILSKMAKNKQTLHAAIKRTRDVDDSVRKMAYLFISKITVKSLTISQRELLMNNGLHDTSDAIKKCVKEVLIPAWLRYYENNYNNFIKAIDAEHASETVTLALGCLFKNADPENLIEQLPIDGSKFVPVEQLTSEIVLYWRCLAEHFKKENLTDEFERIMPELTRFCVYIKEFLGEKENRANKQLDQMTQDFILLQLFEIVKFHDLADEVGRRNLKNLILETLQENHCSQKLSECIVHYFEKVVPDTADRIASLVEVINEIRMPTRINERVVPISEDERHERKMMKAKLGVKLLELEDEEYSAIQCKDYTKAQAINEKVVKLREEIDTLSKEPEEVMESQNVPEEKNDPETMMQCLQIMYYMMQSTTINSLYPALRTLMESIVLPELREDNNEKVLSIALRCIGLCCHVDAELAKKYLMLCFLYISESPYEDVWIAAAQVIFDMLLKYGFEHFNINKDDDPNNQQNGKRNKSIRLFSQTDEDVLVNDKQINPAESSDSVLKALTALIDNQHQNLQSVAILGLCKLILHKRICNVNLISHLIILWHNPSTKENLSQTLCNFFNLYVNKVNESQSILEDAYLPTLRTLRNASEMSDIIEIDPLRVSEMIIKLTCCAIHNNYSAHNQITYNILSEILNPETDLELEVLIKSLKMLDVNLDGEMKNDILKALEDVEDLLNSPGEPKRLLNYIHQFRAKITAANNETNRTVEGLENLIKIYEIVQVCTSMDHTED
ncbi:hypothetical protein QAD02_005554 [Eretmocerus hayati]|uniref:Uncharacterized protein n=1 Tax=Eretmocerus hayati TaxID=131215 RepID=A0ACC2NVP5_9HYME|nr:hypothetical protein QAD02_005554 [Eretmocerus hayati]